MSSSLCATMLMTMTVNTMLTSGMINAVNRNDRRRKLYRYSRLAISQILRRFKHNLLVIIATRHADENVVQAGHGQRKAADVIIGAGRNRLHNVVGRDVVVQEQGKSAARVVGLDRAHARQF